jgi:hypothetical protein
MFKKALSYQEMALERRVNSAYYVFRYKYIVDRGRAVGLVPPRSPCSLPHKARGFNSSEQIQLRVVELVSIQKKKNYVQILKLNFGAKFM